MQSTIRTQYLYIYPKYLHRTLYLILYLIIVHHIGMVYIRLTLPWMKIYPTVWVILPTSPPPPPIVLQTADLTVFLADSDSSQKNKAKRVRTTFTEEQLQVLQANFQLDSNPDGQDLERIAQITGLSKRVTQVWFQNSRARQKKHQQQQGSSPTSTSSISSRLTHSHTPRK